MPAQSDSSVTRISSVTSGATSPMATVMAASPCQPSTMAPQSIEITSPSARARSPGMPCTTSSFTDAQIVAGNGGTPYPRNDGMPPCERMCSSASASSCPVVTPGAQASRSTSRV
jgi:hypothetical protein